MNLCNVQAPISGTQVNSTDVFDYIDDMKYTGWRVSEYRPRKFEKNKSEKILDFWKKSKKFLAKSSVIKQEIKCGAKKL